MSVAMPPGLSVSRISGLSWLSLTGVGAEYDINTNQYRAMDVMSNTLCAAGNVLGDGEWILAGGNLAVSPDGWWSPVVGLLCAKYV